MSPTRPVELAAALAACQHGHVTGQQCRQSGLSPSAVRRLVARDAWERAAPGVYLVVGAPRTWHGRAFAAAAATTGVPKRPKPVDPNAGTRPNLGPTVPAFESAGDRHIRTPER